MKYDCSKEFDLDRIYKKLTSSRQTPTVKACDFFTKSSELELLQVKMERLMNAYNLSTDKHTSKI